MPLHTDQTYLKTSQYKDSANLDARIDLHRRFSVNEHEYHRWAFDLMLAGTPAQAQVLEVGSGSAELWVKNQDRIPDGWQITLSDFSSGMLADGRARLGNQASRFEFRELDVQAIPFEDHTFDLVIANFMLYHVPDRAKAIAELRRVLKPSGCLHAATLGEKHMEEYKHLVMSIMPDIDIGTGSAGRTFGLEDGADQLLASFSEVVMLPFNNNLVVTEVQPLVAYARSMMTLHQAPDAQYAELARVAEERIQHDGAIRITKQAGTFIARGFASQ